MGRLVGGLVSECSVSVGRWLMDLIKPKKYRSPFSYG